MKINDFGKQLVYVYSIWDLYIRQIPIEMKSFNHHAFMTKILCLFINTVLIQKKLCLENNHSKFALRNSCSNTETWLHPSYLGKSLQCQRKHKIPFRLHNRLPIIVAVLCAPWHYTINIWFAYLNFSWQKNRQIQIRFLANRILSNIYSWFRYIQHC